MLPSSFAAYLSRRYATVISESELLLSSDEKKYVNQLQRQIRVHGLVCLPAYISSARARRLVGIKQCFTFKQKRRVIEIYIT
jgi:hypothetical protein